MNNRGRETENEHQRQQRLTFRPESAPTVLAPGVLDMSPDGSLSGPPSHAGHDLSDPMGRFNVHWLTTPLVAN